MDMFLKDSIPTSSHSASNRASPEVICSSMAGTGVFVAVGVSVGVGVTVGVLVLVGVAVGVGVAVDVGVTVGVGVEVGVAVCVGVGVTVGVGVNVDVGVGVGASSPMLASTTFEMTNVVSRNSTQTLTSYSTSSDNGALIQSLMTSENSGI